MKTGAMIAGAALAGALLFLQMRSGHAAVIENGVNGFAIHQSLHIAASPQAVYAALTTPAQWWNSEHTFSQSAANLTLDARAGGCFCETWKGGSVQHLTVVDAEPARILRLRGALGPFQGQGVDGALTFTLKASGDGTDLALDNILGGYMTGGFGKWPLLADGMLGGQLARLKRLLETGSAEPANK